MIVFRIKERLTLTVEDHVVLVQLVMMEFEIKVKLALIAEGHALIAVRTDIILVELDEYYFLPLKIYYAIKKLMSFCS